jgi:formate-dependent nitrite reductase cytochrome c552 subunit
VHQLPDFVYFNHSIHVAKGVGCVTCHGRVDRMPLTWRARPLSMQWCLDCHRAPQKYLRPRDKVFDMAWQAKDQAALGMALVRRYRIDTRRLSDCSVCHR